MAEPYAGNPGAAKGAITIPDDDDDLLAASANGPLQSLKDDIVSIMSVLGLFGPGVAHPPADARFNSQGIGAIFDGLWRHDHTATHAGIAAGPQLDLNWRLAATAVLTGLTGARIAGEVLLDDLKITVASKITTLGASIISGTWELDASGALNSFGDIFINDDATLVVDGHVSHKAHLEIGQFGDVTWTGGAVSTGTYTEASTVTRTGSETRSGTSAAEFLRSIIGTAADHTYNGGEQDVVVVPVNMATAITWIIANPSAPCRFTFRVHDVTALAHDIELQRPDTTQICYINHSTGLGRGTVTVVYDGSMWEIDSIWTSQDREASPQYAITFQA